MDILRTILIVLGIVLVVGIYLADRLKRRKAKMRRHWNDIELEDSVDATHSLSSKEEPLPDEWVGKAVTMTARRHEQLPDEQLEGLKGLVTRDEVDTLFSESTKAATSAVESKAAQPEEVIVLTLMAPAGKSFSGPLLFKVLQEAGLQHGEMGIFHFHTGGSVEPLFSVANILEPGRFELAEMASLETPGLALFMRLPAVVDGARALDSLLQASRQMAERLGGSLCDGQRRPLDEAALAALQSKAQPYTAATS